MRAFLIAAVLLAQAGSAWGFQSPAELEKLASAPPAEARAAAERFVHEAPSADPLALMAFAGPLFAAGHRDAALFWFYAGQLRARYARHLSGEAAQVLTIFVMVSESINAYGMSDVSRLGRTVDKVLEWDEATVDAWAAEHDVYFRDPELGERRARARSGLTSLVKELESRRDEYERRGRDHLAAEAAKKSAAAPHALSAMSASLLEPLPAPGAQRAGDPFYLQADSAPRRLGGVEIAPRDGLIAGASPRDWVRRYYAWLEGAKRASAGVVSDATGEFCARGQGGAVWYLTNVQRGSVTRRCRIPANVHVLVPVFEGLLSPAPGSAAACEELTAHTRRWVAQSLNVRLRINGEELRDVRAYEGAADCYERRAGGQERQLIATHGYWVFLRPLRPGTYRIEFAGQVGGENRSLGIAHDVTYVVTVAE